jgi:hypothetical protein
MLRQPLAPWHHPLLPTRKLESVSLADRIQAARPEPRRLTLKEWLISLDEKERSAAEDMARDNAWTNQRIVEFLGDEGVGVGKDAIAAWRSRCGYSR